MVNSPTIRLWSQPHDLRCSGRLGRIEQRTSSESRELLRATERDRVLFRLLASIVAVLVALSATAIFSTPIAAKRPTATARTGMIVANAAARKIDTRGDVINPCAHLAIAVKVSGAIQHLSVK